ncbi:hypothetical protein [Planctomyces sp. SH-PL14]|uniref:hypothetical protein n=1 Tax=Planctomyces sp. SH-PL14 TaxID=1632864 RepID=UPI0012E7D74B|nr:hypothetical protein [Planctomyces sp. SH-PL14]
MDQISARVRARRVIETHLWTLHFARDQKPGPVDARLARIVGAWFSDKWEP